MIQVCAANEPDCTQLLRPGHDRLQVAATVDDHVEMSLLWMHQVLSPRRRVVTDLLEHQALAATGNERALQAIAAQSPIDR